MCCCCEVNTGKVFKWGSQIPLAAGYWGPIVFLFHNWNCREYPVIASSRVEANYLSGEADRKDWFLGWPTTSLHCEAFSDVAIIPASYLFINSSEYILAYFSLSFKVEEWTLNVYLDNSLSFKQQP